MATFIRTVYWEDDAVVFIDQRLLPDQERYVTTRDYREVAAAIKALAIRGAPAIGVAAALGIALGVANSRAVALAGLRREFDDICRTFAMTRPTARNLFWAVERMERCFRLITTALQSGPATGGIRTAFTPFLARVKKALIDEAKLIGAEDIRINKQLGTYGQTLIDDGDHILTHCNAGALATAGYGTALGVVRAAAAAGKKIHVYVDETRPVLQGARLTAWEMMREEIPATLITDNMAGFLMKQGRIQKIVVGADRIAVNGDTANKIGTYSVAVLAKVHKIPFYVAAPLSTFDGAVKTGKDIPIEERSPEEVTCCRGAILAPRDIDVYNPAFDVTPGRLIAAFVTEKGLLYPPFRKTIPALLRS